MWNAQSGSSGEEVPGKTFGVGLVELLSPSGLLGRRSLKPGGSARKLQEDASRGYSLCSEEISL